ncbi:nucleotide sugar dehydrogenase [Sandaracinomonas limnophila]|uniref:Nucleotide sugar dehydrogenase n=1 Tax=Sandaracinomonas limnophila TaxID=1862386 RepID=A0A437PTJ8_9BACT|nr:nucleotide sugar dehydrogenase [Sandaracinomonas limnophila]RVU25582.1 nucleotide sugar dehydrogenase [Sandaracinomonas limnophila]
MSKKIAIIGLGYVGLPLAVEFGKKYDTLGFDIDKGRIQELMQGVDRTLESSSEEIAAAKLLTFSSDAEDLKSAQIYIVTVPTPIDQFKAPDLGPLKKASEMLGKVLKRGDIVIYESTVYPGCTEEDCVPVLEAVSGLKFNQDFFCGYSPERINPGDKINTLTKIKKVTSGSNLAIAEEVDQLYASIITAGTFKAQSIKVAEASKAIENAQRDVNISFVNELALIFDRIGIDTHDVLDAASTKWNFLPYKPGLVGGHCIGVDPYYLAHKAESLGYYPQVILSGRRVNDNMGMFVANKVVKLMIQKGIAIKGSKALILGVTFKENCPDIRNSKVVDIFTELQQFGLEVHGYDPHADKQLVKEEYGINLLDAIHTQYDAIVLAVSHKEFLQLNFPDFSKSSVVIFDIKSFLDREMVDARL